jgi:hypothetical protein
MVPFAGRRDAAMTAAIMPARWATKPGAMDWLDVIQSN